MRKTRKKVVKQEITETVDLLCNKCAKTLNNAKRYYPAKPGQKQEVYFEGLEEIEVHGGYYSKFIGDMTSIRFSLCEECVVDLTKTFKIPVDTKGDASGEYVPQPKYAALTEKLNKLNHKEWVNAVYLLKLEQKEKVSKKELSKKTHEELAKMYHSLMDAKRQSK